MHMFERSAVTYARRYEVAEDKRVPVVLKSLSSPLVPPREPSAMLASAGRLH